MAATTAPGHAALRAAPPLIAAADLGYGGAPVLREVTLDLAPGERVALLGRSGAGKSTLLDAVWAALVAQGKRVALVPQDHGLVPQLSVLRNALMGRLDDHGALRNLATFVHPRRAERDAVAAILTEVGLAPEIDRPVGRLSGGQRQRTALARALYRGGDVLVADEPLSAVDPRQAGALADLLRDRFPTAIVALHDVGLARRWATRLVGLRQGRILFDRPVEAVDDARVQALYAP
ncbi:ATP-binding cassette domain-containing protein [Paracoccus sanguinis]|uniref:ATP-binding cassette domain-containing protein n=1 Tax=Paracoccus sanguinis TaxID=1545044 RepID=UPI00145125FB|nr:ATP-binding cassette domain-containing protein [Paracoccus sanguinis]QJD17421.1 ATP-binding cassette domain-containing protein [Paracoccus sanguinis]